MFMLPLPPGLPGDQYRVKLSYFHPMLFDVVQGKYVLRLPTTVPAVSVEEYMAAWLKWECHMQLVFLGLGGGVRAAAANDSARGESAAAWSVSGDEEDTRLPLLVSRTTLRWYQHAALGTVVAIKWIEL
jgi:hypothetical protein